MKKQAEGGRRDPPTPVRPHSQPRIFGEPSGTRCCGAPSRKTFPDPFFVGRVPNSNSRVGASDWLSPGHMTPP